METGASERRERACFFFSLENGSQLLTFCVLAVPDGILPFLGERRLEEKLVGHPIVVPTMGPKNDRCRHHLVWSLPRPRRLTHSPSRRREKVAHLLQKPECFWFLRSYGWW